MNEKLTTMGKAAQTASRQLGGLLTTQKNETLLAIAASLEKNVATLLAANEKDLKQSAVPARFVDRLTLTEERIQAMAAGVRAVAKLPDPIGNVDYAWRNEAGLLISKQRVPLGVIGIIYEARPNVTVDAAALCFKAGNAVILRGGKESLNSNLALANLMREVLTTQGLDPNAIQLITETSHEVANEFMQLTDYLDVLIPRGSANLIQAVVKNATVPVIETGAGNCHIYVDRAADLSMATEIIINSKVQRPSVCNSNEKVLVHENIAKTYLPTLIKELRKHHVEVRGDEATKAIVPDVVPATPEDWSTEYNDLIIAIKVVKSEDEAINHINQYSTKHSEVIVTDSYSAGQTFQQAIDAACVYLNASSRFTDGFEFGFGAEIGISTQKLHARGPMGLPALTSYKYVINGNGQTRK
ncbi:glutamate-5-semialdehyde dehydrogenase [Fructilactobacillus frigidiflavus]|uniref:glutamate-5-semialdehyde dehydrogenase n=1 Tax=Fructilactobacillus frigidiflavus TaxID=3242688 RepID=UPI00375806BB